MHSPATRSSGDLRVEIHARMRAGHREVFDFSVIAGMLGLGALLAAALPAAADTESQTDWSGGPDAVGSVVEWSDRFMAVSDVSWRSIPGQLVLASTAALPAGGLVIDTEPNCYSVADGDVDGDGDLDLLSALPLTSFPGTGVVRWYENDGAAGGWTLHVVDDDFYGGYAAAAADLDADGDLDVVAAAFYDRSDDERNGRYTWYENLDGAGTSWQKRLIGDQFYGTENVATADIDGDGDLDVYGSSSLTYLLSQNDDIRWFENVMGDGTVWTQHTVDDSFPDAIEADAEDMDGDGDLDIVSVAYGAHDLAWWENTDGLGVSWAKHLISDFTLVDGAVDAEDLDGDGDADIIAVGFNASVAAWYENLDGVGGSWAGRAIGALTEGYDVVVDDLDGDGRLDVLACNSDLDFSEVVWYRNLGGAAAWSRHTVNLGHDRGTRVIASDLDGDGALEAVFTEGGASAEDVAGLHRWTFTSFLGAGELDSQVLDAGGATTWESIAWDAHMPAGTSLTFQIRTGDDPDALGPWSADITDPGSLAGIVTPDTRYVQVRTRLASADPAASPFVFDLAISTDAFVVASDPDLTPPGTMRLVVPSPVARAARVTLIASPTDPVQVDVVDVSGRRVATPITVADAVAGRRRFELPALPPGVYYVSARSGAQRITRPLVVVR